MSITMLEGGTTTTAGGTGRTFSRTSQPVNGGYEYADVADANFFTRRKVIITSKMPALQSDGTYSKMKTSSKIVIPFSCANGKIVMNQAEFKLDCHPEAAATLLSALREYGVHLAKDAELDATYVAGTFPA